MARACVVSGLLLVAVIVWTARDKTKCDRAGGLDRDQPVTSVHLKLEPSSASLARLGSASLEPLFLGNASSYQQAHISSGGAVPDLSLWRRIEVRAGSDANKLVMALRQRAEVATAFVAPKPELASAFVPSADDGDACPIVTPSYAPYQGYLGSAPSGIDAPAAWIQPGGTGANVWFADIEGGWDNKHEDLPGERMTHLSGRSGGAGWIEHGTAVLGEIAARDNDIGMTGIAPDVERIFTASIRGSNPAAAIDAAQKAMRPGDVLLIELHAIGPRGRFLPMEFWDDVYDAIRVATQRGIVVVEAGGNGGENLDHKEYGGKLGRGDRDSGAILVGAGAPPRPGFVDRSRLDFSNYGTRVDVQGWGRRVASLDYGDLQSCGEGTARDYTDLFSGTSSASPIVAGAALLIQSIAKERHGEPLSPRSLRALLSATGSEQTDGPHGRAGRQPIGPRPDLAAALSAL